MKPLILIKRLDKNSDSNSGIFIVTSSAAQSNVLKYLIRLDSSFSRQK